MKTINFVNAQFTELALLAVMLTVTSCHSSSNNDNPPNDGLTPVLSESNWRVVVGDVFDVFTQTIYDPQLIQPEYSSITKHFYEFPFVNSVYASYSENTCTDGGVATERRSPTSCDGRCFTRTTMLYACASSGGSLLGRVDTESDYSHSTDRYDALTLTSEGSQLSSIRGSLGFNRLGSILSGNIRRSATLTRYESTSNSGTTVLTDVDTLFGYGTDPGDGTASAQLQGSLVLSSPGTGDVTVMAAVKEPFINELSEDRRFLRGILELQAQDGSRLELIADNGDPDTFDVTLSNDGVESIRLSESWDEWVERLSFTVPVLYR